MPILTLLFLYLHFPYFYGLNYFYEFEPTAPFTIIIRYSQLVLTLISCGLACKPERPQLDSNGTDISSQFPKNPTKGNL